MKKFQNSYYMRKKSKLKYKHNFFLKKKCLKIQYFKFESFEYIF